MVRSSKIKLFLLLCKITERSCPNDEMWKIIDFKIVLIASYALGFSRQLSLQNCVKGSSTAKGRVSTSLERTLSKLEFIFSILHRSYSYM